MLNIKGLKTDACGVPQVVPNQTPKPEITLAFELVLLRLDVSNLALNEGFLYSPDPKLMKTPENPGALYLTSAKT